MRKIDELQLKPWRSVSASQIKTFATCQAQWWYEKIAGLRGEGSGAMQRGTLVHAILEYAVVHHKHPTVEHMLGILDDYPLFLEEYLPKYGNDRRRLVDWLFQIASYAAPYLPEEPVDPTYVERGFTLNDPALPVPALGYIDLMEPDNKGITDYKVRSTGRYSMTPNELRKDPQSALYAAVLQAIHDADPKATKNTERGFMTTLEAPVFAPGYFRHLNLCIKENMGDPVRLDYTAEDAERMYQEYIVAPAHKMAAVARITDPRDLTANPDACRSYGRLCAHYNLCAQAGHVEAREFDLLMSGFDLGKFLQTARSSAEPRLTGINPPGGVDASVNSRPDEFSSDYAAKGPYFPDGTRLSGLRKVELRNTVTEFYDTLTAEQQRIYSLICTVGDAFKDAGSKVDDLRAAAAAMIRIYAGDDETKCRRCAVEPLDLSEVPEPEPEVEVAVEPVIYDDPHDDPAPGLNLPADAFGSPVLTTAIEPVLPTQQSQRIALVGTHIASKPATDFWRWSEPYRETICKSLGISDLGDADYNAGYKAFATALRNSTRGGVELPEILFVDHLNPLTPHILSWLETHYLVVRR